MESEVTLKDPTIDRVTITLTRKEASILRDLAGNVIGPPGEVRRFTDALWDCLDNAERDYGDPCDNLRDARYFDGEHLQVAES